jgi:enterochelin esterase-like enzyme
MTEKKDAEIPEISWINPFKSEVPGLLHKTYFSSSMNRLVGYGIYLPPDYKSAPVSNRIKKFPVIYWLHGKGGNESTGFNIRVPAMFHKAITESLPGQAIMVFPNCGSYSMFCDSYDKKVMGETILIRELIPLVDSTYSTLRTRKARALEGFSMGGFGAVKLAFKYPELFCSVLTYAGSFHDIDSVSNARPEVFKAMFGSSADYFQENSPYILAEKNCEKIKKNLKLKFVNGSNDFTLENNYKLNLLLDKFGINYDFKLINGYKHIPVSYYQTEGLDGFKFHLDNFNIIFSEN